MKKLHNILLTFTLFFLSACSENKTSETWVVGVSPDNPPYEFVQNGHTVGFDIDLMNEIGKYAGKKIEVKNMELHSVLAALSTKNVEVAISGLTPTPERQEKVDFSIPYFTSKIAILYRSEDKFSSAKDLKDTHIVGAQLGSTWNAIAHELAEKQGFKVSALSSNLMLVEDLKAKRIDAIVLEESQVDKFVEIYPELAKLVLHEFDSIFAIAMPKNSPDKKIIDEAIKALQKKGEIEKLSKKWGLN